MRADDRRDQDGQYRVTILATSDLHLNLLQDASPPSASAQGRSIADVLACLHRLRAEDPEAVLVDNGDVLQGSVFGEALAQAAVEERHKSHPMIQAMNVLGYDALSLGNHDLDYGVDFLANVLTVARFDVLCANLRAKTSNRSLFSPSMILTRQPRRATTAPDARSDGAPPPPLRIGLIGLLPPEIMLWNADQLGERYIAEDLVATARAEAVRLRAAGADLVVALCHSGIGRDPTARDGEHAADRVAALTEIDAVVAGHAHQLFPGPEFHSHPAVDLARGCLAGTPLVMPGVGGSHIGRLRLDLDWTGARWRVLSGRGELIAVPAQGAATQGTAAPNELSRICADARRSTARIMGRRAGSSAVPIHSHFALAADCPATRLLAEAKRWHVAQALERLGLSDLPVLAAASAARSGGRGGPGNFTRLPTGQLFTRHLAELCPFPNTIRALRITGAGLRDWLEHSAGIFNQIGSTACDVPLINPARPGYGFDVILGLTYEIDPTAPPRYDPLGRVIDPLASRITDLRHEGQPLRDSDVFALAVSSYRAMGSGAYPGTGSLRDEVYAAPIQIRQIVADYLAAKPDWRPEGGPIWHFTARPGRSAVLQTSPEASQHLPHPGLEPLSLDERGFLDLRVVF